MIFAVTCLCSTLILYSIIPITIMIPLYPGIADRIRLIKKRSTAAFVFRLVPPALATLAVSACATVFSGSTQKVTVQSEPSGAHVYLNGWRTYRKTPCKIYVDRKGDDRKQRYTLRKEGYNDYHHEDHARMNPTSLGNILFGGVIGLGVDWMSGSIYKYDREVYAILEEHDDPSLRAYRERESDKVTAGPQGVSDETHPEGDPSGKEDTAVDAGTTKQGATDDQDTLFRSDVDLNIPVTDRKHPYRFALIIGNEDYSSHQMDLNDGTDVAFARSDARVFREYAVKTLGIPRRNIVYMEDATAGKMSQGIHKMNLLAKNSRGQGELYFYYAGHGLPHEASREPYLLPVDVNGKNIEAGLPLKGIYKHLTQYPSRRVTVFLDACFTGGARQQGLLAARSVRIEPRQYDLQGNIIVFSASSGIQSAMPYQEQQHGFFTYYLLRKLQATGGDVSYGEMADYLQHKVGLESVLVNDKEQSPRVNVSPAVGTEWEQWRFVE